MTDTLFFLACNILFITSFAFLIFGLIKPKSFSQLIWGKITRKKIALIFGVATFVFFVLSVFSTENLNKTEQATKINQQSATTSIEWAIYEKPLLVAVGVNNYNGDNLEFGRYKAEVKYSKNGVAEIFDVIVSNKELSISDCISIIRDAYSESYKSNVKAKYSHYAIGGIENTPVTIDLIKGQYIHIIPNTYLGNSSDVSGIFSLSKI